MAQGVRHGPVRPGAVPNALWCADFKGEFQLGNSRYCYPLTVTDHASRFLLVCEALNSTREEPAITVFEQLFRERGLPEAIRSDNGVPFASPNGLFTLSKLSVWWLRLGIEIEPDQSLAILSRTVGTNTCTSPSRRKPAAQGGANTLQQQARFEDLRSGVQYRGAPARGPRHEMSRPGLLSLAAALRRPA